MSLADVQIPQIPAGLRERIKALTDQLDHERRRAEVGAELLERIFRAPDVDAIFAAIELAEDDWAAFVGRGG